MDQYSSLQQLFLSPNGEGLVKGVVLNSKFKVDPYQRCYTLIDFSDSTLQIQFRLWGKDETAKLVPGTVLSIFLQKDEQFFNVPLIEEQAAYSILANEKPTKYLMQSPVSFKKMHQTLRTIIDSFENVYLKAICNAFLEKYEAELKTFPGGLSIHHNYISGLMYHLYSMVIAAAGYKDMQHVNYELVVTGALCHDIGKFRTLSINPVTNLATDYTLEGTLNDHIVIGILEMNNLFQRIPMKDSVLEMQLIHIVATHHGDYSIEKPKMLEAEIISKLDLIDSRIDIYSQQYNKLSPNTVTQEKVFYLKNRIYRP